MGVVLLGGLPMATTGCDRELAGEIATLTGTFLGDVAAITTTSYLLDAIGIEENPDVSGHEHEGEDHEHSHSAEPLHDHEH